MHQATTIGTFVRSARLCLIAFLTLISCNLAAQNPLLIEVTVHAELDSSAAGCDVDFPNLGINLRGIDRQLRATIDREANLVIDVRIADCDNDSFVVGPSIASDIPVALNEGIDGEDVIELSARIDDFLLNNAYTHIWVSTLDPRTGSEDLTDEPAILLLEPMPIPTLGTWALIFTILLLAATGYISLRRNPQFLIISLVSLSSMAIAANFMADGDLGDWNNEMPGTIDPIDDSVPPQPATDITLGWFAGEDKFFFARVDLVDIENTAPEALSGEATVNEDDSVTVNLEAMDLENDDLTFSIIDPPNNGLLGTIIEVDNDSATVEYTPDADYFGDDSFSFMVNDGALNSEDPGVISITVRPVNDPPSFTAGADEDILEDAGAQSVAGWATNISPGPANESDQTVTFNLSNDNNSLFATQPAVSSTGTLTYTPADDANGSATVTIEAMDDGGTANGGIDTSPPQTFTITVNPVNDPPSFVAGPDQTVLEDAGGQTVPAWATSISPGPPDEAAQVVTFNVSNDNNALFSAQPVIDGTGELTYTPADDANGVAIVTVEAMDDGGTADGGDDTSDPQTFTITVTSVNDPPSFVVGADQAVLEDAGAQSVAAWATSISAGPPDESGQVVSFNLSNTNNALFAVQPAVDSSGTLTYTPADDANGSATITIEAMDDGGTANGGVDTSPSQMFTITVDPVNDAPSFVAGPNQEILEDSVPQTVSGWATSISPGPADESAQAVTFNVGNDNNALFSAQPAIDTTGELTFTPAPDANGVANVTVTAMDEGGTANGGVDTSAPQMFTITVLAVNDAPSFTGGPDQAVLEDAGAQSVAAWATGISPGPTDEAGQVVTFNLSNTNNALFAAQPAVDSTGTLTYTPADDANGSATVTIEAMDDGGTANGGVDTSPPQMFTITVTPVNDAPSFIAGPNQDVLEDASAQTVSGWAGAISPGPIDESGQLVSFNLANDNNALFSAQPAVDGAGNLTYTPAADANGLATVTIEAMDDGGTANGGVDTSAPLMFTITVTPVNDPPTFSLGPDQSADEDSGPQTVPGHATGISPGPADESAQILTFNLSNDNNALFAVQPAMDATTGDLTYTPADDASGSAIVMVELMDDGGTANGGDDTGGPLSFQITINPVNDPPVNSVPGPQSVLEDSTLTFSAGNGNPIMVSDIDATSMSVQVSVGSGSLFVSNPGSAIVTSNNTPAVDISGTLAEVNAALDGLDYTPNPDYFGPDSLNVSSDDGGSTGSGGPLTDLDVVNITVDPVNDPPTFDVLSDQAIDEDAGPQTAASFATNISPGPANEAGQMVSFNVSNDNNGLFSSQPAVDGAGTLTYTPADNANGSATVTIAAMDDGGTANGGNDTSANQTFTITITSVNDEPVLDLIGGQTIDEETLLSFTASASDPNDTPPNNLSFSLSGEPAGASIDPVSGLFTWTPTELDGPNVFMFDVIVTDDGIPSEIASETITVTVNEVNLPPVLNPIGDMVVDENTLLTFMATATDPDLPAMILSFSLSGEPTGATIDSNSGIFEWTPTEAQGPGMYTFDVIVSDSLLADSETITVTVNEVNDPPTADDETYDATGNVGLDVPAASGLLVGDTDGETPGSLTATAETVATTMGGSATIAADGGFTYTPPAGFTGGDTFNYTLNDNDPVTPMTDTGLVTITMADMIWFIDNSNGGPGTGTLADPFAAIATYEGSGVPAADQCIYIEESGNGAYTGPLTLDNDDILVGKGATGTLDTQCGVTLAPFSATLPTLAGTRPQIDSATNAIVMAMNNTVRGLNVGDTTEFGIQAGHIGSPVIDTVSIIGTGPAMDIGGSASLGSSVEFDTLQCSTSGPLLCLRLVNSTGTFTVNNGGTGMTHTGPNDNFRIQGGSVSVSYPGRLFTGSNSSRVVSIISHTSGTVTFSGPVTATTGTGILAEDADGTYNFNGEVTLGSGFSNNAGIDIINGSEGTFTFTDAGSSITDPSGPAFVVSNSSADVSYAGSIFRNTFPSAAVAIANNSGTVTLSGFIVASTSVGDAFVVVDSGTINAAHPSSRITTSTGIAVSIVNTDIGPLGVNFMQVNSSGGSKAIVLENTGTTGGFTITGDAGSAPNGSGGTIQNKVNAIELTDTMNFSMDQVNFSSIALAAVKGEQVDGFSASNATFNSLGGNVFDFDQGGTGNNGVTGTVSLSNLGITDFDEYGVNIVNEGPGTLDLDIINVDMDDNDDIDGQDAIRIRNEGSANVDVLLDGGVYNDIEFDVLNYQAQGTGTSNLVVTNVISTNGGGPDNNPNGGGIVVAATQGTTTFNINSNSLTGVQGEGVQIIGIPGAGQTVTLNGTIGGPNPADGNTITSDNADGIDLDFDGDLSGTSTVNGNITVQNNNISFDDDGIGVTHQDAGGTMNVMILDNTLTGILGDDGLVDTDDGIFIFTDDDVGAAEPNLNLEIMDNAVNDIEPSDHVLVIEGVQNGNNVCLDLRGTSTNVAFADIELDTDVTADLNVVQTTAGNLSSANNSIPVADLGAGANFGGSADCIP